MPTDGRSILIVASLREDRRALFDALDGRGFGEVLSARDAMHARTLLRVSPRPLLAVLDFCHAPTQSAVLCAEMPGVPVIGLLGAGTDGVSRTWHFDKRPPGVVEWLRTPVDPVEAAIRARQVIDGLAASEPASPPEDSFRFAFDDSIDEMVLSDPLDGRILAVNAAFEGGTGLSATQASAQGLSTLLANDSGGGPEGWRKSIAQAGVARFQCDRKRADGSNRRMDVSMQLVPHGGRLVHFSILRETAGERGEGRLLRAMAQIGRPGAGQAGLQGIAQQVMDALDLDLIVIAARTGGDAVEPIARIDRLSLPPEAPDPLQTAAVLRALGGEATVHLSGARGQGSDRGFPEATACERFVALPLLDSHNNVLGVLVCAARHAAPEHTRPALEIAAARFAAWLELRAEREQSRATALLDGLTGLPNRLLFNDRLESTLREARRNAETFAVMFVDLDRFKEINDSLGHATGDQVLIAAAKRLRAVVRSSDTVARYAGDEFTLILRHIVQREDVLRVADKLLRSMEAPLTLQDGSELHVTASIGISFHPDDATDAENLIKHADMAMYSAKGRGRNNRQSYVAVPEESHRQRREMEDRLRQAEANGELSVYYQPQIDVENEDIVGMEALVRWQHPDLGMISPAFFIPLAEETGLIIPIGEWVLRRACADASVWQRRSGLPLRVGVNLSALQLMQPNLVGVVESACGDAGLDPHLLDLELTESISVKLVPNLEETLASLRALGCGVSIDDFGTGQSSLDYIKRFPADRIKIDQSFVRNIGMDPDDEAIVRAILDMAHSLNRKVVAEGVETEQHLAFLRECGCDEVQGYLFCRPLSVTSFTNMLSERRAAFAEAEGGPVSEPAPLSATMASREDGAAA
jgi:diguanylate cyclase (GGDEF)-like protein/PAS domain S-box-containing protein